MVDKIQESTRHLYGCLALEEQVSLLYITATKKLPDLQLIMVTTAISHDSQKHIALIKLLLGPEHVFLKPEDLSKEFKKSLREISKLMDAIARIEDIDNGEKKELIKNLTNVEDLLHEFYSSFIESELADDLANFISEESNITTENLNYILHLMKLDNLKHREMLIESLYFLSKTEKQFTPIVKYQNPDAWVQT